MVDVRWQCKRPPSTVGVAHGMMKRPLESGCTFERHSLQISWNYVAPGIENEVS